MGGTSQIRKHDDQFQATAVEQRETLVVWIRAVEVEVVRNYH